MIGRNFHRQRSGSVIQPRSINGPQRESEAKSRTSCGAGLQMKKGPGGIPIITGAAATDVFRTARTPTAGIPAMSGNLMGKAICTFYYRDGDNQLLGTETDYVYNDIGTLITGNRKIKVYFSEGVWMFSVMSCT